MDESSGQTVYRQDNANCAACVVLPMRWGLQNGRKMQGWAGLVGLSDDRAEIRDGKALIHPSAHLLPFKTKMWKFKYKHKCIETQIQIQEQLHKSTIEKIWQPQLLHQQYSSVFPPSSLGSICKGLVFGNFFFLSDKSVVILSIRSVKCHAWIISYSENVFLAIKRALLYSWQGLK